MTQAPGTDVDQKAVIRPTDPQPQPPRATQLCEGCGAILSPVLQQQNLTRHPNCAGTALRFNQPEAKDPSLTHPKRIELMELIRFASRNSVRSGQVAIGPSEIGGSCERRLAYRIAGIKAVNRNTDPWPSIQGTAIHDWLQRCMERSNAEYVAQGQPPRWITEKRVQVDPIIHGTSDVYDMLDNTVIDWKTMGETAEAKLIKEGPSYGYFVQVQTYGLGFLRAGYPVSKVALMFLRRGGKLSSARYYEWPFNPAVAQAAIERVYRVGRTILDLRNTLAGADIWPQIPADSTSLCGWCPFFTRSVTGATEKGCPGH